MLCAKNTSTIDLSYTCEQAVWTKVSWNLIIICCSWSWHLEYSWCTNNSILFRLAKRYYWENIKVFETENISPHATILATGTRRYVLWNVIIIGMQQQFDYPILERSDQNHIFIYPVTNTSAAIVLIFWSQDITTIAPEGLIKNNKCFAPHRDT